jgi:hypothetical protein
VGILLFVLATNWLFVRSRLDLYAKLAEPVDVVSAVMKDRPADEGILLVNLPSWMDSSRNTYPIGVEFVPVMGNYLFVEELMAENLRVDRPAQAVKVPDLLTSQAYGYGVHEQADGDLIEGDWAPAGSHTFIIYYDEEGPVTRYSGQITPQLDQAPSLATFGPYDLLSVEADSCEDAVHLTTVWRVVSTGSSTPEIGSTTSLFVQLLGEDGQLIAQADAPPMGLRPDLIQLPSGWQMVDHRELEPGDGQPKEILVGAYDFMSGERFPATDGARQPLPDNALRIPIGDCP